MREMGDDPDVDFDMGEFFIAGKYQRRGNGRRVACKVFDMFRGRWTVRQLVANIPAREFWRAVVSDYVKGRFTESPIKEGGWDMVCFRFDNTQPGGAGNA